MTEFHWVKLNVKITFGCQMLLASLSWAMPNKAPLFPGSLRSGCCHADCRWHVLCLCPNCDQVWVSSVTEIRAEDLRVQDLDSPPKDLHFMVTPPSNGHLALKSAPMREVLNFTQAHIDQGQLLFVHKGKILIQITYWTLNTCGATFFFFIMK